MACFTWATHQAAVCQKKMFTLRALKGESRQWVISYEQKSLSVSQFVAPHTDVIFDREIRHQIAQSHPDEMPLSPPQLQRGDFPEHGCEHRRLR